MTRQELIEKQSWTLQQKIDHSLGVIDQFYSRMNGNVYVSFSGGKDSTVLLDLCRVIDKNIKAVFCNTGNEYPDIVKFVRKLKNDGYNIDIIYPQMLTQMVLLKYGFPLISKETSHVINDMRHNPFTKRAKRANGIIESTYDQIPKKFDFLVDEDFDISDKCCYRLKKKPFTQYEKRTGLYPIIGVMASESRLRTTTYIRRGGCNTFTGKIESMPLSIWTEDDIWAYIKERNLDIAEIYHKGAKRTGCMFCGYGAHLKSDNRLELLYKLYPKWYNVFMDYTNNGITYREALRKVLATNGLSLPDEINN